MSRLSVRRLLAMALAVILVVSLAACGKPSPAAPADPAAESTATPTDPTTTPTNPPVDPTPKGELNPLTGEFDMLTANNRPIGFVVTDEDANHTQINIDKADMYFEAETEAGIPRMLVIFSSIDRIPDEIGPIRSARMHFVKFAASLDMMYGHIGGSPTGYDTIRQLGVDDFTATSVINEALKNSKNRSWNRKVFTKSGVTQSVQAHKHALTTTQTSPYVFSLNEVKGSAATTVNVKISNSYNMAFTYDADKGVYQKHRNSLNTPIHISTNADGSTGNAIEVKNVLVMFDKRSTFSDERNPSASYVDFALQSGSGLLACNGTSREIQWKNTSSGLKFYEADGTTLLQMAAGKTFVCLTADTNKSKTTVQ